MEQSEADTQGDIGLTLLQMHADTLTSIDAALMRVEAGQYGSCAECAQEISLQRLRIMPFAVRCQACEQRREQAGRDERSLTSRTWGLPVLSDAGG